MGIFAIFGLPANAAKSAAEETHSAPFSPTKPPKPAIDFSFESASGHSVDLSDFRGKFVLINFWTSWCPPCVKELPTLNHFQEIVGQDRLVVIPISLDADRDAPKALFQRLNIKNLNLYFGENGSALTSFGVYYLPFSILFDPKGQEIGRVRGDAVWDAPQMLNSLQPYLSQSQNR